MAKKKITKKEKGKKIDTVLRIAWFLGIIVLWILIISNLIVMFSTPTIEIDIPQCETDEDSRIIIKGLCSYVCSAEFNESVESSGISVGSEENTLVMMCECGELGHVNIMVDVSTWEEFRESCEMIEDIEGGILR
jgi:hypothetical protein